MPHDGKASEKLFYFILSGFVLLLIGAKLIDLKY